MRRAARTDDNHQTIREAFKAMGCSVADSFRLGDGFPDLCVGCAGHNLLVEIKDGAKPPSKRRLTPEEQNWHDNWLGNVHIVETEDQAIKLVNRIRAAGL